MSQSCLNITLNVLMKYAERQVVYAEIRRREAMRKGVFTGEPLSRDLECAKAILRLMRRFKKDAQIELFEELNDEQSNLKAL